MTDTFLSIEDARQQILDAIRPLGHERVMLDQAGGRVLAQTLVSPIDWPRFDNSAMDGYALRFADIAEGNATLPVPHHVHAGDVPPRALQPGEAFRIMTGAPVPEGADTVVMRENTHEGDSGTVTVHTLPAKGAGANIRKRGEDMAVGQTLFAPGTAIDAGLMGLLASFGRAQVRVFQRPRVAILSTGDELVEIDTPPGPGQIVNSSSYMIAAQIRDAGGIPVVLPIVPDTRRAIEEAFDQAARTADIVVSMGGVSMGDADLVRDVILERATDMHFWKIIMKPGKPLAFGAIEGLPFIGLPGNPVSSFVTFLQFARPALRKAAGYPDTDLTLPRFIATTSAALRGPRRRPELVRGQLMTASDGLRFTPLPRQGSGNLRSVAAVNALGYVPEATQIEAGDPIEVELFAPIIPR